MQSPGTSWNRASDIDPFVGALARQKCMRPVKCAAPWPATEHGIGVTGAHFDNEIRESQRRPALENDGLPRERRLALVGTSVLLSNAWVHRKCDKAPRRIIRCTVRGRA
jgi:hypothetical protein